MFCENCGYPLKDDDRFCTGCGKPVQNDDQNHSHNPNRNRKKKFLAGLLAAVIIGLSGLGGYYYAGIINQEQRWAAVKEAWDQDKNVVSLTELSYYFDSHPESRKMAQDWYETLWKKPMENLPELSEAASLLEEEENQSLMLRTLNDIIEQNGSVSDYGNDVYVRYKDRSYEDRIAHVYPFIESSNLTLEPVLNREGISFRLGGKAAYIDGICEPDPERSSEEMGIYNREFTDEEPKAQFKDGKFIIETSWKTTGSQNSETKDVVLSFDQNSLEVDEKSGNKSILKAGFESKATSDTAFRPLYDSDFVGEKSSHKNTPSNNSHVLSKTDGNRSGFVSNREESLGFDGVHLYDGKYEKDFSLYNSTARILDSLVKTYADVDLSKDELYSSLNINLSSGVPCSVFRDAINEYFRKYDVPAAYQMEQIEYDSLTEADLSRFLERIPKIIDGGYPVIVAIASDSSTGPPTIFMCISGYKTDSSGNLVQLDFYNHSGTFGSSSRSYIQGVDHVLDSMLEFAKQKGYFQYLY